MYRGSAIGGTLPGRYLFADFVTSRVWSIALTINATTGEATASDFREHTAELGAAATSPASFAEDAAGELYIVTYGGAVYRLSGTATGPVIVAVKKRPAGVAPIGFARPRGAVTGSAVSSNVDVRTSTFESSPEFTTDELELTAKLLLMILERARVPLMMWRVWGLQR